jgi:hypothetical protein
MQSSDFLALVYDYLKTDGDWPKVRALQIRLRREGSLRLLAARAGTEHVICDESMDGICWLTVRGLARVPAAGEDVENYLQVVRYLAKHYLQFGLQEVTAAELQTNLGLTPDALGRLSRILYKDGLTWGSWSGSDNAFQLRPRDDVVFLEDVASLDDLFARLDKNHLEAQEAARLRWQRSGEASDGSEADADPAPVLARVPATLSIKHDALRAVANRDLEELASAIGARAWKAAAVFAGCCLEALMLDLWFRHEDLARRTWKGWPDEPTLHVLVTTAADNSLISSRHKDLASTIRSARNLVHPLRAASEPEVNVETVNVLLAALALLDRELTDDAA